MHSYPDRVTQTECVSYELVLMAGSASELCLARNPLSIYGKRMNLGRIKLALIKVSTIRGFEFWKVMVCRRTNKSKNNAHSSLEEIFGMIFVWRNRKNFVPYPLAVEPEKRDLSPWMILVH